jgi:hypothetical protein
MGRRAMGGPPTGSKAMLTEAIPHFSIALRGLFQRPRRPKIDCAAVVPFDGHAVRRRRHANYNPAPRGPIDAVSLTSHPSHQALGDLSI